MPLMPIPPMPGPTADGIDVLVVEHAGEPGSEPLYAEHLLRAGIKFQQHILNQVLGVRDTGGEAPGEPIEILNVRAHEILEVQLRGPGPAVRRNGRHKNTYTFGRLKRFPFPLRANRAHAPSP